jgi:hypothetical protein
VPEPTTWEYRSRIAQASGMVSVQADCSLDAAVLLMVERAEVDHLSIWGLAGAVLDRSMRFN